MRTTTSKLKAPNHLRAATARWWRSVCYDYELEEHHRRLLTLAAESWDRCEEARKALAKHGLVFTDRFGQPRKRPECSIEIDNRIAFCRIVREIGLDIFEPDELRAPVIRGNARLHIAGRP